MLHVLRVPTSLLVPGSVVGGFALGRRTGRRDVAGVVLAAGLAVTSPRWVGHRSPLAAAVAVAATIGLVGVSHPLSHRLGPWTAVLTTGVATGLVAAWAEGARGRL